MSGRSDPPGEAPVEVWWARPVAGDADRYRTLIPLEEQARADRLRIADARTAYLASRALLRIVVATVAGPDAVGRIGRRCPRCGSADHGGPTLGRDERYLSLSRTRGLVAVAVSDGPVGVDVEDRGRRVPPHSSVFSAPERHWMTAGSPTATERTTVWAAKEAVGKLCGLGLIDAGRVVTDGPPGPRWTAARDNAGRACWVRSVPFPPPFVGVVAGRLPVPVEVRAETNLVDSVR